MELKLICEECGEELPFIVNVNIWGELVLKVSLCETCVEDDTDVSDEDLKN